MSGDDLDTRRGLRFMLDHLRRRDDAFLPSVLADLGAVEAVLVYMLARQDDDPGPGAVSIRLGASRADREIMRRALCRLTSAELVDLVYLGDLADAPSKAKLTAQGHHAAELLVLLYAADSIDEIDAEDLF